MPQDLHVDLREIGGGQTRRCARKFLQCFSLRWRCRSLGSLYSPARTRDRWNVVPRPRTRVSFPLNSNADNRGDVQHLAPVVIALLGLVRGELRRVGVKVHVFVHVECGRCWCRGCRCGQRSMWGLCALSHVVVFVLACTTSRRRPQGNRGSQLSDFGSGSTSLVQRL